MAGYNGPDPPGSMREQGRRSSLRPENTSTSRPGRAYKQTPPGPLHAVRHAGEGSAPRPRRRVLPRRINAHEGRARADQNRCDETHEAEERRAIALTAAPDAPTTSAPRELVSARGAECKWARRSRSAAGDAAGEAAAAAAVVAHAAY